RENREREDGEEETLRREAVLLRPHRDEARHAAVAEAAQKERERRREDAPGDEVLREEGSGVRRARGILLEVPRDRGHRDVDAAQARAERGPAALPVDEEAERGSERRREDRGHAPVADAFGAPRRRDEAGHVRRGSREEAGPEE